MLKVGKMNSDWTSLIMISNVGSVFCNSCFQSSGRFSNIYKATGTFKHVDDISGIASDDSFDVV